MSGAEVSASTRDLTQRLKAQAYGLGFDLVGATTLGEPATRAAFDAWLAAGYHGTMSYLDGNGATLRRDSTLPHVGATHALVVAINYGGREPSGPVARYARGDDYHDVLRSKLRELHTWLEQTLGRTVNARPYVDSGPVLERDLAQRAGLGWFGKNTMLINPGLGSFFFLGSLFVDVALEIDAPFAADRCGTCTRCLDACPTQAFVAPRVLDATKCISYLTIELREEINAALREGIGDRVYGCDVCQEVCPWNVSFATELHEEAFRPREMFLDAGSHEGTRALAREILMMTPAEYAAEFKGSAIKRAKLWMLQRNACVVLGNVGTADDLAVLKAMTSHERALVRVHAAWAIDAIRSSSDV